MYKLKMNYMKRMNTFMKRTSILLLALVAGCFVQLSAQPVSGKIYNIVNRNYSGSSLSENSSHGLVCATTDATNYSQLWLFVTSTNGFTMRNAATGRYANSKDGYETQFTTSFSPTDWYVLTPVTGYYAFSFRATDDASSMHSKGTAGNIVRWNSNVGTTASQWTLNEVTTVTQATLEENWAALKATAKNNLQTALTNANTTLSAVCTATPTTAAVALQTTDAAAAGYLSTNAQETSEGPIANLIDGSTTNYFHSSWQSASTGYHYLQIDMGTGVSIQDFVINYTTRPGNFYNKPATMVVSGSNDGTTFTPITTLSSSNAYSPLPVSGVKQESYQSSLISSSTAYRYLRFTVTATNNNAANSGSPKYPYFSMAEFSLTRVNMNASSGLEYKKVAAYQLKNAISTAQTVYDATSSTQGDYEDALAALNKTLYAASVRSYNVTLTTNDASPSLYILNSKRASNLVWTYTTAGKIMLTTLGTESPFQAWLFKENPNTGYLQLIPYADPAKVMGAASVVDGADKIIAVTNYATSGYAVDYTMEYNASSYPNYPVALATAGYSNYMSNYGGSGNAMGFYNNAGDNGTRFSLATATFSHSTAYLYLQVAIAKAQALGSVSYGTDPGSFNNESAVNAFNTALTEAQTTLAASTATDADYTSATNTLTLAQAALPAIVTIQAGKFYVLESANISGNYSLGAYAYVGADNTLTWKKSSDSPVEGTAVWQFGANGSNYYLKNIHTGGYVSTVAASTQVKLGATQGTITVTGLGNRQFNITGSTLPLHAQQNYSHVVGWSAGLTSGSAWYIKEVSLFKQSVTITDAKFATLCLNYSVTVPTGVTAYYVTASGINGTVATLTEVGSVIPANTAVILNGEAGTYNFVYTTNVNANASTIAADNKLQGTLVNGYIAAGTSTCYALAVVNNKVGLYQVTLNVDGTGATGTTHFLNNANKAYMSVATGSGIKGFTFKLNDPTGIEMNTVEQKDNSIFDLTGRRVEKVTSTGLYIVNGKKIFIKK